MKRLSVLAMACVLLTAPNASATLVVREIELATDSSQIINGGFGSGVAWRPTFAIEPFTLDVGDTIDVTVRLDQPVFVLAGAVEQENAAAFATSPSQSFDTTQTVELEFLETQGDLLSNHLSFDSTTEGGIGGHPGAVDLTDTWFSFQGFRYSITIAEGTGFPGVFDSGTIAIQTQGAIQFTPVPEASGFSIGLVCCLLACAARWRFRPSDQRILCG